MTAMVLPSIPMAAAEGALPPAPDGLEITDLDMDDHNIKVGGQDVNVAVYLMNTGTTTITEDFEIYLYINVYGFLESRIVETDLEPEVPYLEIIPVYIDEQIGSDYTLDAYINGDHFGTQDHDDFIVTLFGIGITSMP